MFSEETIRKCHHVITIVCTCFIGSATGPTNDFLLTGQKINHNTGLEIISSNWHILGLCLDKIEFDWTNCLIG